jgi:Phage portal protein, SPP1 Gp6-like
LRELSKRASRVNLADLARQDEAERLERYQRAWAAYDGEGPLPFDDEDGQACDNVRLGYGELIVDKGVSFLAGKGGVEFQLEPPAEAETEDEPEPDEPEVDELIERARALLDDAWPDEKRAADFHDLATNGGVCGHPWVRLYESGRLSVLDPSTVTAVWSEDDIEIIERYLLEWNAIDEETGLAVLRRKRIEPDNAENPSRWEIHDEEWDEDAGWMPVLDNDGEPIITPWERTYAPVLDAKNRPSPNTFYGRPDLTPTILDQIEQLQSVASEMRRICRQHGHPIPVVIGEDASHVQEIDVAIGELLAIPNVNAKLGQIAVAELTSSLALYKELKAALFESAKIPRVALGDRDKSGALTGVALQIEYAPLIELTETKRITYGALLRKAAECILDLKGMPGWTVKLGWPEVLPSDDKAAAESAEADLRMGVVSKQTIAEKRGYDWALERERIDEEAREAKARFDEGIADEHDEPPVDITPPSGPEEE